MTMQKCRRAVHYFIRCCLAREIKTSIRISLPVMPRFEFSFLRALFFLAPVLFFFSSSSQARAKEKEEPITRSPSPQPVVASVYVGERTLISLPLRGRIEEPVTILIRKKPRFGLISEPERVNRQTWRVWYSPLPGSDETIDSFSYAAKSVDSPVSVAAQVQVSIMKRPAELVFSDSLDFGSVPVGDTLVKEIDIQNSGGKTAVISPVLNLPWKLVDAIPIQIMAGETKKIRVAFSPDSSGEFAGKLALETDTKRAMKLNGSSQNPLQWPAKPVLFTSSQRATPQSVSFKNLTDRIREVVFEWPDFLEAPSHVTIEPDSILEIPVKLKAAPNLSWEGPVSFSCGNFKGSLTVAIETAPDSITLEPASVLDLGEFPLGSSANCTLRLTNSGGRPARLTIDLPNWIKLNPSPSAVLINPGESAHFEATATPQKVGTFDFSLPVHSDSETLGTFRLRVTARAARPVEKLLAIPAHRPVSPEPSTPVANIPPVEECALVESKPHSITISWKLTSPDTERFLIERRDIKPGAEGQVETVWKAWEGADVQISGDTATAHFRKLPPGTFWNIRITGIDSKGQLGQQPNRSFRIETRVASPLLPLWFWILVALAGTGSVIWLLKNKVTLVRDDLDARISNLEKQ